MNTRAHDTASVSDWAKETFRQLALKKLPPTPENYALIYQEVSGTAVAMLQPQTHATPPAVLSAALASYALIEKILTFKNKISIGASFWEEGAQIASRWRNWQQALSRKTPPALPANLTEESQKFILTLQEHLISQLQKAKNDLMQSSVAAAAPTSAAPAPTKIPALAALPPLPTREAQDYEALCTLVGRLIEFSQEAWSQEDGRIGELCRQSLEVIAQKGTLQKLSPSLGLIVHKVGFISKEQIETRQGLMRLVSLFIENIGKITPEDRWLVGQVQWLKEATSGVVSLRKIDDIHMKMNEIIFKQSELHILSLRRQEELKALLAAFIDKLSEMVLSSQTAHEKISQCAKRIQGAKSIDEISSTVSELILATGTLQLDALRSKEQLLHMKHQVEATQVEAERLSNEITKLSATAKHDTLTGALNRRGLEETIEKELARALRKGAPVSLGFIDVDDFKKLNDSLGHKAGDEALIHLMKVAKAALRPQDSIGRYGGEEFIVVLPDCQPQEAQMALLRVQRSLTREIFLYKNQRVLITFSAGCTLIIPEEGYAPAIERADRGMYQAKRAGKNQVLIA